jgi:dolichol-phosphate mannosyltransferase
MQNKILSIVIPVYNEENNIEPFLSRLTGILKKITIEYEIIFCLDPSTDNTENIIRKHAALDLNIKLIKLSRRFGQPAATMAGLRNCIGNYCVIIDVDLQDPPELIIPMLDKIHQGNDVVYAKRNSRRGETIAKKAISFLGYRLIKYFSEVNIPNDVGDYRIISRRVINHLISLKDKGAFLRGLVAFIGYKQDYVVYEREERISDRSKYNQITGSFKIGLNGLIGFSSRPLYIMSILGFFFSLFSFILGGWYLIQKLIGINLTPGLSTTILAITFFSGIQLLSMGLIGEYVGRIYEEVKNRPLYIIDEVMNINHTSLPERD